jgi:hypothetical protein
MTITAQIRKHIEELPLGTPFTTRAFLDLGSRAAIDQALSRLVRTGSILRITRGLFVRSPSTDSDGLGTIDAATVANVLAAASGDLFSVHGVHALRYLGLSTQSLEDKVILHTNGSSRHLRLAGFEVELRRTAPRKLVLAGRPAGLALSALLYLGKAGATMQTLASIRESIGLGEYDALRKCRRLPGWLSDRFHKQGDEDPSMGNISPGRFA